MGREHARAHRAGNAGQALRERDRVERLRRGGLLRPELTVAWGCTCGIFLLAGISLPTSALTKAAMRWREHALIQGINLGAIPLGMLALCTALTRAGLLHTYTCTCPRACTFT